MRASHGFTVQGLGFGAYTFHSEMVILAWMLCRGIQSCGNLGAVEPLSPLSLRWPVATSFLAALDFG